MYVKVDVVDFFRILTGPPPPIPVTVSDFNVRQGPWLLPDERARNRDFVTAGTRLTEDRQRGSCRTSGLEIVIWRPANIEDPTTMGAIAHERDGGVYADFHFPDFFRTLTGRPPPIPVTVSDFNVRQGPWLLKNQKRRHGNGRSTRRLLKTGNFGVGF